MTDPAKPSLRARAEAALKNGDVKTAAALGQTLGERKVLGSWDQVVLGRIALASGKAKIAEAKFNEALRDLPGEGSVVLNLAEAQAAGRGWAKAASTLAEAIALRPGIPDLHERHGIYLSNGLKKARRRPGIPASGCYGPKETGVP